MIDQTSTKPGSENSLQSPSAARISTGAFAVYVVAFFVVWSLRATVFIRIDESIDSPIWRSVYSNSIKFIIWVVPVFLTLGLARLRPPTYLKLITPINKRGLVIGTVLALVWLSLVVLGESIIQHRNVSEMLAAKSSEWLGILTGLFFSPICEEILFRGFFLNRFNESFGFWKSNLVSALLFMLAHWPYWVSKFGFSARVIKDSINVFLLGCLFGWLMKKANSLWPAIGAHIANNFLSGLIHG
ncbi:MAG TPA: CPBP family intramembrane glutamic endopeptidase [Blastocatellia bacterium]|nr:CPBP family intramembrane glutamic endopeptidase [Blastocatellia bacterium]